MDIKRITCRTAIEAAALCAKLEEAGIKGVIYDETNSKVARGILDPTIDVMVNEENLERANAIYDEMLKAGEEVLPWCPSCGSENVVKLDKPTQTSKGLLGFISAVLCFVPFRSSTNNYMCKDCGKKF